MIKNFKIRGYILIGIICSMVFAIGFFRLFYEYRSTIIAQQQKQLLHVVKTAAQSSQNYFEKEQEMLDMFTQSQGFKGSWGYFQKTGDTSLLNLQGDSLINFNRNRRTEIVILNNDMHIICSRNNGNINTKIAQSINTDILKTMGYNGILGAYKTKSDTFVLGIGQKLHYNDEQVGYAVMFMDLEYFYNEMLSHIKADDKGYVMAKDNRGIILMHPVKGEIGLHAVDGRKEKYPDVDFSEMSKLIDRELKGEEGVFEFSSYWFSDTAPPKKAQKFSAFTPLYINADTFWIFGMNMDYDRFTEPFMKTLTGVTTLAMLMIIAVFSAILVFIRVKRKQNELVIETAYLKEINSTLDKLHKNEAAMHHAQKLQTIGTMTGGIAHEFNNILTPILGYSQLLMEQLPKETESFSDSMEIYKAAMRAKELVGQISSLSRKDIGSTHFKNIDIAEVVLEAIKTMELIKPSNITIKKSILNMQLIICGNKTQIHQAIVNLCTNAYHAMENNSSGELNIEVDITNSDALEGTIYNITSDDFISIIIKDTGIGISEDEINNIFNPFYTTKPVGKGTGLGLPFVEKVVTTHGGIIKVKTELSIGTSIIIYLPFNPKLKVILDTNIGREKNDIHRVGKRILIIDDNVQSLKLLKRRLESNGHMVVAYTSPQKALDEVLDDVYEIDTAIIDYNMPEITGLQVARQLKLTNSAINVIIISGLIKNEILEYKEQGLIDSFLSKPINMDKLEEYL